MVIDEIHLKKVGPNFEAKVSSAHSTHKVTSGVCEKVQYRIRANSYSKVTMTTVNQEASRCYPQRVNAPTSPSANNAPSTLVGEGKGSGDASGPSPLPMQDVEVFPCPVPTPTSERCTCYSTNSLNSLDAIDVEPPDMFKQTPASCGEGCGSRRGEQTDSTRDGLHSTFDEGDGDRVGGGDLTLGVDRRSVESSDMGYVSSVSPAATHDVKETPTLGRVGSRKMAVGRALSGDASKLYVPMVFSSSSVEKDRNLFVVQACLVECSDGLIKVRGMEIEVCAYMCVHMCVCIYVCAHVHIFYRVIYPQDLILFKALHNYQLVQCDEQEEEETGPMVSAADSFTLETSLEDLEFGFGVVSNTQKVSM